MEDQRKPNQQEKRKQRENTSGKSWFDMPKAKITPELERDWQIIQMRNVLDPKRHYRKDKRKAPPTYCQVGTVIEGAAEFYSSRMTRRERKQTILEEFLHDTNRREYFRDRYRDFQNERAKGTRAWRKAQRNSRK
ncbi:Fcf2 pre-rRNA processing-domain-containing protein [Syncephalis fuscata]|nr:Fcf2 pre-rRNA processing-domain-containing protein [Syncephalis fuscata]